MKVNKKHIMNKLLIKTANTINPNPFTCKNTYLFTTRLVKNNLTKTIYSLTKTQLLSTLPETPTISVKRK